MRRQLETGEQAEQHQDRQRGHERGEQPTVQRVVNLGPDHGSRCPSYCRPGARGGVGAAVGNGKSLFQTSSTMSQRSFCCDQRTMYLPESTAGVPGGSLAPAGKAQCQRPGSTATGPPPPTVWARSVSGGRGAVVLIIAKQARTASLPFLVAIFGGLRTAS